MPTISLQHSVLERIQRINGIKHEGGTWPDFLPKIGCPVEEFNEEEIEIEVFPDRPDLLSHETMARAVRSFIGAQETVSGVEVVSSGIRVDVDRSLEEVRPVIMAAVVRGVDTGSNESEKDAFIQSLMDHQEKLHLTLGRKRSLSSIGVHDLSKLRPPFRYETVDEGYSFIPLASENEMSIAEVLTELPKGIEYAHLMDGMDRFPVILDSNDEILSFPPIINGDHTTVNEGTRDFFIDVTGTDSRACEACLLLVCLSLSELGGKVESVEISGWDGGVSITPNFENKEHRVPGKLVERILGVNLREEEISESISRMGGELIETRTVTDGSERSERWADCVVGEMEHIVSMPRWRSDIMHPVDIIEDIAIGFGYDNLPRKLSSVHIDAVPLPSSQINRRIRASFRAVGLQETQSLTLSNETDQFESMRWEENGAPSIISNPITVDHTMMRQFILPSLLRLLSSNRHHVLPQRVYELGEVVQNSQNSTRASWACAEVGSGFSSAKGISQALIRDMGGDLGEIEYRPLNEGEGPWIAGRGAKVIVGGEEVGQFGEIDPEVSNRFGLKTPIHGGEFDVERLARVIPDPVL
ncbi:MAG: phenylalanine--tRNA ligase subunit beta [Euryarchaeota archaeon]|nr:phenylalanine--tRNA ligase subunit beta [Euryarchaeota archaeon]|tara:strand:+ start:10825 stop:12579 length:1755 start_codon:yes stop_codon:yes gene_type:complete